MFKKLSVSLSREEISKEIENTTENEESKSDESIHEDIYKVVHKKIFDDNISTILIHGEYKSTFLKFLTKKFNSESYNTNYLNQMDVISLYESSKNNHLINMYNELSNSAIKPAFLLLDDIELLIEYTKLEERVYYSNKLFLTLQTMLKKSDRKIVIICSTKLPTLFNEYFDYTINLSCYTAEWNKID